MTFKFYRVHSLAGSHDGIHAIRNIMKGSEITLDQFCEAAGFETGWRTGCPLPFANDPKYLENTKIAEDNQTVRLVVYRDVSETGSPVTQKYNPAILICG
jgi:hypothetical protein